MRRRSLLFSTVFSALLCFLLLASFAVGIVAAAGGGPHPSISIGRLVLWQAGWPSTSDSWPVGPGLPVVAGLVAALNAFAALLTHRWRARRAGATSA